MYNIRIKSNASRRLKVFLTTQFPFPWQVKYRFGLFNIQPQPYLSLITLTQAVPFPFIQITLHFVLGRVT